MGAGLRVVVVVLLRCPGRLKTPAIQSLVGGKSAVEFGLREDEEMRRIVLWFLFYREEEEKGRRRRCRHDYILPPPPIAYCDETRTDNTKSVQ